MVLSISQQIRKSREPHQRPAERAMAISDHAQLVAAVADGAAAATLPRADYVAAFAPSGFAVEAVPALDHDSRAQVIEVDQSQDLLSLQSNPGWVRQFAFQNLKRPNQAAALQFLATDAAAGQAQKHRAPLGNRRQLWPEAGHDRRQRG